MDRVKLYQEYIQKIIIDYKNDGSRADTIDSLTVFDYEGHHYQLMLVGWWDERRVYGILFHFDIIDSKIWIQYNGTEVDVAQELVEMGVPKKDIVIGFHSPFARQFTEYALG